MVGLITSLKSTGFRSNFGDNFSDPATARVIFSGPVNLEKPEDIRIEEDLHHSQSSPGFSQERIASQARGSQRGGGNRRPRKLRPGTPPAAPSLQTQPGPNASPTPSVPDTWTKNL